MTSDAARYLLELFGPTLEQTTRYCCVLADRRLAVVILDEPRNLTRDEIVLALRLHKRLDLGLLIVL